jgi:cell division protease FtsH
MNRGVRTAISLVMAVLIAFVFLAPVFPALAESPSQVGISQVVEMARLGQVQTIKVSESGNDIKVFYKDGTEVTSRKEPSSSMLEYLDQAGVSRQNMPTIEVEPSSGGGFSLFGGGFLFPMLMMGGVFMLMMLLFNRRRGGGQADDKAMSFSKSKARVFIGTRPSTKFDDVAGADEAKEELAEVVDFLKSPLKYAALGARIPKGVLLVGPPGTGKTLVARAVAGEAGVPFFSISGSEFVEMFVGVGAARVRDLFNQAKTNAPAIVFVDELDAVGRQRGAGLGGGNDEREQTLNQILVEMDGFDQNTKLIVIAATNRPDVLDPTLMRPGRFDRQVILDKPDTKGRLEILKVHAKGKPLAKDVSLESLAKQTPGFAGADIENLVNEAAILAARRDKNEVTMDEMEEAMDRVIAGPQRKSRVITPKEKLLTAYHEMGHALVARMSPNADPVRKVSIVARGMMGGYTRMSGSEDRFVLTKSQLEDTIAVSLGGYAAERMVFGEISTGASNDIERATKIARKMVTEYGMSEKLGPVAFGQKEGSVFLGRDLMEQRNYSDKIAGEIDREVRDLMDNARAKATAILTKYAEKLQMLADAIVERETLNAEELELLWGDLPKVQRGVEPKIPVEPEENRNNAVEDGGATPATDIAACATMDDWVADA